MQWVYFPLHPETPGQGRSLEALFSGRGYDLDAMHQRMQALMDDEKLPYGHRTHTYNSRFAQELASWADTQLEDDQLHGLIYRAYFAEGRNIGDPVLLAELASRVGLSGDVALARLDARVDRGEVDADWALSRDKGVTAVPTFVAGQHQVVGAQSETVLRRLVEAAGAVSRGSRREPTS